MRVFAEVNPDLSRAMKRVVKALKEFAPSSVEFVPAPEQADLVVLHTIGFPETERQVNYLAELGKKYAIIQYCLRTTQEPSTEKWIPLWAGAEVVWSYYDLPNLLAQDKQTHHLKNFYDAPLGCDSAVFEKTDLSRRYMIATSGYVPESECVLEAMEATEAVRGKQFHLGPGDQRFKHHVSQHLGISDEQLARFYSQCQFVAGLRRVEGFELPAVEGLFCGARPICFDAPHYRRWFGDLAEYVPEGDFASVQASLTELFKWKLRPVSSGEIAEARELFNWQTIIEGFWETLIPRVQVTVESKPRLLWVGDAGVSTGFAKCTHETIPGLQKRFDCTVLGLNYFGDPHEYPFPIYPTRSPEGGDFFGVERLPVLAQKLQPDVIVIQNDPWNFPAYFRSLDVAENKALRVGAVAVDGMNCRGTDMNGLALAVFWTRFGKDQAVLGGYTGRSAVVPLGVDLATFYPMDREDAFKTVGISDYVDKFIVGRIDRNQPRKRLDLTVAYFAEWIKQYGIDDAYLYLHVAPTGDQGWDLRQLTRYYGLVGKNRRLILAEPEIGKGVDDSDMRATYNCFDVQVSTSQGEGWHLPTMEGMACRVPQIVGKWAALAEWTKGAALQVPCSSICTTPNYINVIGAVPDKEPFIQALQLAYSHPGERRKIAELGYERVSESRYRWKNIADAFTAQVWDTFLDSKRELVA